MRMTLIICFLCTVLLAGLVPSFAFASDPPAYFFLDEDPEGQLAGGYTENYAFNKWAIDTVSAMKWWGFGNYQL